MVGWCGRLFGKWLEYEKELRRSLEWGEVSLLGFGCEAGKGRVETIAFLAMHQVVSLLEEDFDGANLLQRGVCLSFLTLISQPDTLG